LDNLNLSFDMIPDCQEKYIAKAMHFLYFEVEE